MANNQINFNINFKTNTSGLKQARDAIDQITGKLTGKQVELFNPNSMKSGIKMINEAMNAAGRFEEAMTSAYNVKIGTVNLERFNQELAKNGTSIQDVRDKMLALGPVGEQSYAKMASGLMSVRYETVETTTLLDKLGDSLRRALLTFTSLNIINKVKGSIGEAYGYVKNLDTSLNQIRIVTGKSADEMERFANTANKAAASLGKATTDYTKASTTFYQQGLSDTEVEARTRVTLMASNTTGTDTKQVADQLTAIWNGFNVGAEDAEHYIDVVAAVAKSTASNLDEMATAMSKVASMADSMGVSEEQLAAQMSTVIAVTRQAPESVGTAFKTIYARIADIKAGSEDAEISLGNYSGQLAALGINVLDAAGNLKDMGQIIEEVGGSWQNYSKEQQVAIAGIMGGQRQVNQLRALFDNWDKYTKTMEVAANAEGELQKEQDIFMESAQGQLQKLRTEWEGVLDSLLNSDDIIKVAKAISPLITGLEKMVDAFGGGIGILQKFSPLLLQIVSPQIAKGFSKMANQFLAVRTNAKLANQQIQTWNLTLKDVNVPDRYAKTIKNIESGYIDLINVMSAEQRNAFQQSFEDFVQNTAPKVSQATQNMIKSFAQIKDKFGEGFAFNSKEDLSVTIGKIDELEKRIKILDTSFTEVNGNIKKGFRFKDSVGEAKQQIAELTQAFGGKLPEEIEKVKQTIENFENTLKQQGHTEEQVKKAKIALNDVYQEAVGYINEETEKLQEGIQVARDYVRVTQESDQAAEGFNSTIQDLNTEQVAQSLLSIGQGFMSILTGIKSIIDLGSVWQNENLSTWEKVYQTAISLGTVFGVLTTSINGAIKAYFNLTTQTSLNTVATIANTVAEVANEAIENGRIPTLGELIRKIREKTVAAGADAAATGAEAAANGAAAGSSLTLSGVLTGSLLPALGSVLLALAPIIVAIGAIVAIGLILHNSLKTSSERMAEHAKAVKEATDEYNNFKKSIEELKEAENAIDGLTRGTDEYREAVEKANEKVLELIENNKDLAKYVQYGKDGQLTISEEGIKEVEEKKREKKIKEERQMLAKGLDTRFDNNFWTNGDSFSGKTTEEGLNSDANKLLAIARTNEKLDKNTDNEILSIIKALQKQGKTSDEIFEWASYGNIRDNLQQKDFGFNFKLADLRAGDYSKVSKNEIKSLVEGDDNFIADFLGVSPTENKILFEKLKTELIQLVSLANTEINQLPSIFTQISDDNDWNNISSEIIEKFKNLAGQISDEQINMLGIGLSEMQQKMLEEDFDQFTTDLMNLDFTQGEEGLEVFREKYSELTPEIEKYIEAQIRANTIWKTSDGTLAKITNAMGKISQMNFGDMLSEKDYNDLISKFEGLEKYFVKIGDKYQYTAKNNIKVTEELRKAYKDYANSYQGVKDIIKDNNLNKDSLIEAKNRSAEGKANNVQEIDKINTNIYNNLSEDDLKQLSGEVGITIGEIEKLLTTSIANLTDKEIESLDRIYSAVNIDKTEIDKEMIMATVDSVAELNKLEKEGEITASAAYQTRELVRQKELDLIKERKEAELDFIKMQEEENRKTLERDSSKIEEKMAHASGEEWVKLYKKKKQNNEEIIKSYKKQAEAEQELLVLEKSQLFNKLKNVGLTGSQAAQFEQLIKSGADYNTLINSANTILGEQADILLPSVLELYTDIEKRAQSINENLEQANDLEEKIWTATNKDNGVEASWDAQSKAIDRQIDRVQDKMSHATGTEYVQLRQKREDLKNSKINLLSSQKTSAATSRAQAYTELEGTLGEGSSLTIDENGFAVIKGTVNENIVEAMNKYNDSKAKELDLEYEILDLQQAELITIDKTLDEQRKLNNENRILTRLQKEQNVLTGDALLNNLKEQREEAGKILKATNEKIKAQREDLADQKQGLSDLLKEGKLGEAGLEIRYDSFGGVSNGEEILSFLKEIESPLAADVQTFINNINDAADATAELEESFLNLLSAVDTLYDNTLEQNNIDNERKKISAELSLYEKDKSNPMYAELLKRGEENDKRELKNKELTANDYQDIYNLRKKDVEDAYNQLDEEIKNEISPYYKFDENGQLQLENMSKVNEKAVKAYENFINTEYDSKEAREKAWNELNDEYGNFGLFMQAAQQLNEAAKNNMAAQTDVFVSTIQNFKNSSDNIQKISGGQIETYNKKLNETTKDESLLYGDAKIANMESQERIQSNINIALQNEIDEYNVLLDKEKESLKTKKVELDILDKKNNFSKMTEDEIEKLAEVSGDAKRYLELQEDIRILNGQIAYDTANLTKAEEDRADSVRKSIEIQKKAYQEKLKIAEEAIKRESSAQHQLKNSLKEVDRALNKVKKDQEGLSGPALIAKLQEEIALQEQKKKVLEQQLSLVKAQIQSLVALYTAEMSKRFEVPISFVVDENGVANLDELYASVAKMPEKLQAEGQQAIQSAISNLNSLASNMSSIQSSIDGMTDSIESLNKKIKETKEAEAFRLKDEKWYKIDQELKSINKELARLQRLQKHLVGDALIKNLTQQQELLEKQAQAQANKLATMKAELQVMQQMLAMQGVMFDSDGLIANYATVFAQGNDKVNNYMKSYQSLYDSIQDLEEGIQETFDKKLDLEYEKAAERLRLFNAKIDIELDLGKAKREWQNFKREFLNTLNGMQQLNDSLAEKAKQGVKEILDMSARETPMLTEHVEQIMQEIRTMQAGGWSNLYGTDQETALSDLANYRQQLQDTLSGIADKIKEVNETYLQQLEKIKSKFDEQLSNYEQIQSIIEHDMNLIKIIKGEQSYDLLANYYDKSSKNYEAQIQMLRGQVDYWKNLMDQAQPGTEEWETFRQNWQDALSKLNSAVDAALSNLISKYENAINKTFAVLEKQFTNGTDFDWIKTQWDWANKEADLYLDKISQEYNIQKLNNKYQEAANKATDPNQRARILKIMDEELKKLREKDKLTKYDVERANKMYDLRMKQLELEDAANNKTKMRLRRDSEGNYRYEYVADQDKVAELKQEILDMQEEIRQFDLSALREKKQEAIQILQEFNDQARELTLQKLKGEITEEEYNERINALKNHFETMYGASAEAIDNITKNLEQSTTDEMLSLEMITQEELNNMKKSADAIKDMIAGITPIYDDMINNLINHIAGEGGFTAISEQAIEELKQTLIDFTAEISKIEEAAGVTFESIVNGIDPTIDMMYDLIDVNDDLINKYQEELDAISDLIAELHDLETTYQDVYNAAMQAVDAALELRRTEMDYNDNSNVSGSGAAAAGAYGAVGGGSTSTSTSTSGTAGTNNGLTGETSTKEKIRYHLIKEKGGAYRILTIDPAKEHPERVGNGEYYKYTTSSGNQFIGQSIGYYDTEEAARAQYLRIKNLEKTGKNILKSAANIANAMSLFDTGGYTGSWGNEGKIAMLHEKELVLNKEDTANILAAVKSTRASSGVGINSDYLAGISHSVDNIYDAVMRLLEVTSASLNTSLNAAGTVANTQSNVSNTINANFPNAGNMNEIQNALMNLTNYTSQRLHSNQRGKSGTAQSSTYRTKSF